MGGDGLPQIVEACEGSTVTLDATDPEAMSYQWQVFENNAFVTITGETSNTIAVNESGYYKAQVIQVDTSIEEKEFVVDIYPAPQSLNPPVTVLCDEGGGFASFDLTSLDASISNGQTGVVVSYYLTQSDAEAMTNSISSPFQAQSQTIFARVDRTNVNGCYAVTNLDIIIQEFEVNTDSIPNLELEDVDDDGIETFDLTVNEPIILNGQSSSDFSIIYFATLADAQTNSNPIATPSSFINTVNPQTIYFLVQNFVNGCAAIGEFNLVVLPPPPDADSDGVPDDEEDLNDNGNLEDDDTDNDGIPNYLDDDDDGDLVSTEDETTGIGAGEQFEIIDTDDDSIQNYLDNDDDGDGILTANEDYNGNGDPIDDDTNNNGIPDFLDAEVALSVDRLSLQGFKIFPNPASSSIEVANIPVGSTIRIVDIHGKVAVTPIAFTANQAVDVSDMTPGVYFVEIKSGTITQIKKFIKL